MYTIEPKSLSSLHRLGLEVKELDDDLGVIMGMQEKSGKVRHLRNLTSTASNVIVHEVLAGFIPQHRRI